MIRTLPGLLLVALGTVLVMISAVGLIRLPDVFNRMNAVAKAASLGLVCVLTGVLVLAPGPRTAVVVVAAVALQLLTAPIGGYALSSAAYRAGSPLWDATRYDDLGAAPPPPAGPARET